MSVIFSGQIQESWKSKDGLTSKRVVPADQLTHLPIVKAFLKDLELVEMTINSDNIGFTRTYRKQRANLEFDTIVDGIRS